MARYAIYVRLISDHHQKHPVGHTRTHANTRQTRYDQTGRLADRPHYPVCNVHFSALPPEISQCAIKLPCHGFLMSNANPQIITIMPHPTFRSLFFFGSLSYFGLPLFPPKPKHDFSLFPFAVPKKKHKTLVRKPWFPFAMLFGFYTVCTVSLYFTVLVCPYHYLAILCCDMFFDLMI